MKFVVNCTELKKAADKAMAVMPKKTTMSILEHMQISTEENAITIHVNNSEQFVEVRVSATVIEPGVTYIHKDNIKKVYGLSDMVTVEVEDGLFNVKGSKKKSAVPVKVYKEDDLISFPTMENADMYMDIEGQRLVQTLGSLSCFISDNFNNIMMTGYSFDGKAKRIVALDSHRIGLRRMENDFMTDKKIVVPGVVYSQLKKISTAKSGNIQVLANDKHVEFIGEDFKLYSRLIAGEYFNIDTMLDTFYDYQLVIDPKELYKLCKEYYGVAKSAKAPMYFTYNKEHNLVRTGISTSDYITVDELETVDKNKSTGLNKDFIYGFNPLYIYEAMQLFDGEVKCCGVLKTGSFRNVICPIVFDDDEYLAFVLPVNIASELTDKFIEYLNAA